MPFWFATIKWCPKGYATSLFKALAIVVLMWRSWFFRRMGDQFCKQCACAQTKAFYSSVELEVHHVQNCAFQKPTVKAWKSLLRLASLACPQRCAKAEKFFSFGFPWWRWQCFMHYLWYPFSEMFMKDIYSTLYTVFILYCLGELYGFLLHLLTRLSNHFKGSANVTVRTEVWLLWRVGKAVKVTTEHR